MKTTYILGDDTEVTITWEYSPPSRGARDSLGGKAGAGPPLEPDEPASLELVYAHDANGQPHELSEKDEEMAREQAWDQMADNQPDEPDDPWRDS